MRDERQITPHYLDDPDWDISEDGSEGGNWGVLFAHIVLVAVTMCGYWWLHQPIEAPKVPRVQSVTLGNGMFFNIASSSLGNVCSIGGY